MGRCGRSGCGCRFEEGPGVDIAGPGSIERPVTIGIADPLTGTGCVSVTRCVGTRLGNGLQYVTDGGGRIETRRSGDAGNQLAYGTDGGLLVTGAGGSDGGYATVAGLIQPDLMVVGGTYGIGYGIFPEGGLRPYEEGMNVNLIKMMHVPVRRGMEGVLYAQAQRSMSYYTLAGAADNLDTVNTATAEHLRYLPGGAPTGDAFEPTYPSKGGYFGFGRRDMRGVPRLADVFRVSQRRKVLYLEMKDLGASVPGETPNPALTLDLLRNMITSWGLTQSVIVGVSFPTTLTGADLNAVIAGMEAIRATGTAIGVTMLSQAEANALTPAALVAAGYTWVFLATQVTEASPQTAKAYKDAGLQVMSHNCWKQYQYRHAANTALFGPNGGLRGVMAADPVYVGGSQTNYAYRQDSASWGWGTVDYGRYGYTGDRTSMRDKYRGYVAAGEAGQISIDGDVINPLEGNTSNIQSGYWLLQGEQCPLPGYDSATDTSNSYEIHTGFVWDAIVPDTGRWASIFFAVPEDRSLYDWTRATTTTRGYQLQLSCNGNFQFVRYDGVPANGQIPNVFSHSWPSGWSNPLVAGVEYRVRVQVYPDRIVCGRADGGGTTTFNNAAFPAAQATLWRGPYFYLGRHFFSVAGAPRVRYMWSLARTAP